MHRVISICPGRRARGPVRDLRCSTLPARPFIGRMPSGLAMLCLSSQPPPIERLNCSMNSAPSRTTVDLIRKLVSYDTTSRNSNLELIDYIEDYLAGHGVSSERVYDDEKRKANLYATLGPRDKSGIMLSGHVDVVPVDGQAWTTDPFELTEKDGRLYGRGSADMKSFVALSLAAVPEFLRRGLHTPIHLAISYDEEVGCIGVRGLIDRLNQMPVKPAM